MFDSGRGMISSYTKNIEAFLDVLFPPICVSCRMHGAWWCASCRAQIEWASADQRVNIDGVEAIHTLGMYHDPLLRGAIHALKYRGGQCVMKDIVCAVSAWIRMHDVCWKDEIEISIQPLIASPQRARERGFDQAVLLAQHLSPLLAPHGEIVDLLSRVDTDSAQATITDPVLRSANVADVFQIKKNSLLPDAVLLIDDVVTTGSTFYEAANVLRRAGVKRVYGFALALGK